MTDRLKTLQAKPLSTYHHQVVSDFMRAVQKWGKLTEGQERGFSLPLRTSTVKRQSPKERRHCNVFLVMMSIVPMSRLFVTTISPRDTTALAP